MAEPAKHTVKSVAKAFEVLRAFNPARPEMTITDVANQAGLDRGTAFRLIHTLIELGYLAAIPGERRFRLTLKCLDLGFDALSAGGLKAQSAPLLRELVPGVAEAASLGILDKADVVYVERVQVDMGRHDLDRRVGSRTGAYATALGHAILAWEPPDHARALLASGDRVALSDRTLTDLDALCDRLAEVRQRGYAVSDGENAYGLRTVAMPVIAANGRAGAAVSLTVRRETGPMDGFLARALPALTRVVESLSRAVIMLAAA
ncbi:IclR family transcriptional regulator [Acidisphaera sp. L21]|uniref:IclR family transcriptional regulator n=1 Tax=Acidisphaera sp. L21 TaxID=1641851 RepID=UPI001C20BBE1|nr:IclR family transcriptional regulator C-terminal domain-containing protein [Acidisphaera sp. L21]